MSKKRRMSKKKSKKKTRRATALHLALPATSANLGPAFDAAALAMDLYITIHARPAPAFSITVTGRDQEICRNLEDHLILNTYSEILQAQGQKVVPLLCALTTTSRSGKAADRQLLPAWRASPWPITSAVCSGRIPKSSAKPRAASTTRIMPRPAGWEVSPSPECTARPKPR